MASPKHAAGLSALPFWTPKLELLPLDQTQQLSCFFPSLKAQLSNNPLPKATVTKAYGKKRMQFHGGVEGRGRKCTGKQEKGGILDNIHY